MPDKESLHIGLKRDFGELSRTVVRIRVIIIPGRDLRISVIRIGFCRGENVSWAVIFF